MASTQTFLVVDSNVDNGNILIRSLSRKFPAASIQLCRTSHAAIEALATEVIDAVVLHRTDMEDATHMIEGLRQIAPTVPIVAVSGVDRRRQLLAAGAAAFLNFDEWLRIGAIVQGVIEPPTEKSA